jgi:hypothetical protein
LPSVNVITAIAYDYLTKLSTGVLCRFSVKWRAGVPRSRVAISGAARHTLVTSAKRKIVLSIGNLQASLERGTHLATIAASRAGAAGEHGGGGSN